MKAHHKLNIMRQYIKLVVDMDDIRTAMAEARIHSHTAMNDELSAWFEVQKGILNDFAKQLENADDTT